MLTGDLESARALFLQQLQGDMAALAGHEGFTEYWQQVEFELPQVEDQALLEKWLSELLRDRERLRAMEDRQREASTDGRSGTAEEALRIIARLLGVLDDVERRLRHRLWVIRERLGAWVYLAGPGVKRKPRPKGPEEEKEEEKKRSKREAARARKPKAKKGGGKK
ncbi:MAG: hypothetical protein ACQEXJ_03610 [Myxococcota bacterium]